MSLTRKVAYNTTVQIIGKVITTIISLVLIAALTRYLGVAGYGQYTTIFAYSQFFGVMADFGFFWFLVREISKKEEGNETIIRNVLTFKVILALAVFVIGIIISLFIPQYQSLRAGIAVIMGATFWLSMNNTYVGIFQSKLRMDKAALTDVLGRILILILVLWLIRSGGSLFQILWAYFLGNMVNFFLSAILGQVYAHYRPAFDWKYWRLIFQECLPIFVVTTLALISFKIDTPMLSLLKSDTDVGIYGPPYKVVDILILFPGIFMGNVFPIVAHYLYTGDQRLNNAFQKAFDFLVLSAVPIVVGIIFIAQRVIFLVAGEQFVTAHTVAPILGIPATSVLSLQILVLAVGISFLSHLFSYTVVALGKQSKLILPNLILVVFNIGLNLILIPKISYIGAAIVTVLTESLVVAMYSQIMKRYIKLKINFSILWKVLLSGIALGVILHYFAFLSLWILVPLGGLAYIGVLYLLGGFSKESLLSVVRG